MAERRDDVPRGDSGTSNGADLEPLRGGMREVGEGRVGPEHEGHREVGEGEASPPAPYHDLDVPHPGGLAAGATPTRRPPPVPDAADVDRRAGDKIPEERRDDENEAANAPRTDPGAPAAGDSRRSS